MTFASLKCLFVMPLTYFPLLRCCLSSSLSLFLLLPSPCLSLFLPLPSPPSPSSFVPNRYSIPGPVISSFCHIFEAVDASPRHAIVTGMIKNRRSSVGLTDGHLLS